MEGQVKKFHFEEVMFKRPERFPSSRDSSLVGSERPCIWSSAAFENGDSDCVSSCRSEEAGRCCRERKQAVYGMWGGLVPLADQLEEEEKAGIKRDNQK